jgi:hypothetical protein
MAVSPPAKEQEDYDPFVGAERKQSAAPLRGSPPSSPLTFPPSAAEVCRHTAMQKSRIVILMLGRKKNGP